MNIRIKKLTLLAAILGLYPAFSASQSINVDVSEPTRDHPPSMFQMESEDVLLQEDVVKFLAGGQQFSGFLSYGISPHMTSIGFLSNKSGDSDALILNSKADTLAHYQPPSLERDDPSIKIYPFSDGRSMIRQNIGRFSFYSALGDQPRRYSSVTGTEGGEAISRLAANPTASTVVLYNPKVVRGEQEGSRAHLPEKNGDLLTFFQRNDRTIRHLKVTENGQFIGILSVKEGTERRMHIFDRYGNELYISSYEDQIKNFELSEDARSLLVYSDNRALAYRLPSGEKLGSTSFRSTIVTADFFPERHLILSMTGEENGASRKIGNIRFQGVQLEKREIESTQWNGSLGIHPDMNLEFQPREDHRYLLRGASKELILRVQF